MLMGRRRVNGAAALLMSLLLSGCARYRPATQALQQQVSAAVPTGSSPEQVAAYLDRAKIAHTAYRRDPTTGNTIEASLQTPIAHALIEPSYDLLFHFNEQNRLTSYEVTYLGYVGL